MQAPGLVVTLAGHQYSVEHPWGSVSAGRQLDFPVDVAVDGLDRLYVFQRSKSPIVVLDRTGEHVTSWGEGVIADAHGIFISTDQRIFLVDRDAHQVLGFSRDWHPLLSLGERHGPRLQAPFNHPTDVAIGADGSIFVSDGYANAAVHCFWPDGRLRWTRGRPGRGPGEFMTPHGIWAESDGRILVADRENNRIQFFDSDGTYLDEWTDLFRPMNIFVDNDGRIYVTEQVPRLSVFSRNGTLIGRCRTPRVGHGVWVDSRGDIYLALERPNTVAKFVRLGRAVGTPTTVAFRGSRLVSPNDLRVPPHVPKQRSKRNAPVFGSER
jgi:sugar lactone lactonase YvrE